MTEITVIIRSGSDLHQLAELLTEIGLLVVLEPAVEPAPPPPAILVQPPTSEDVTPQMLDELDQLTGAPFDKPPETHPVMPFIEGLLTYKWIDGVKCVKWGDKWKAADGTNAASPLQRSKLVEAFANSHEMENSLHRHFGVRLIESLTWEQFLACGLARLQGRLDPRWYKPDPVEQAKARSSAAQAKLDGPKSVAPVAERPKPPTKPVAKLKAGKQPEYPAQFIVKAYKLESGGLDPKEVEAFIANMQASPDPLALVKLIELGVTPLSHWEKFQALAQGLADGTFTPGTELFAQILETAHHD